MAFLRSASSRPVLSGLLALAFLLVPGAAQAGAWVAKGLQIRHISDQAITLNAGVNTLLTTNTTSGGDPVMVLMNSSYQFVAAGDDENGYPNPKIVYTVPTTATYHIIIYSYGTFSIGDTDLLINGTFNSRPSFGGATTCPNLPSGRWRIGTAAPPGGVQDSVVFVRSGVMLTARDDDGGVGLQSQLDVLNAPLSCVLVGAWGWGVTGTHDLYVNDALNAGSDGDGDGLGKDLEALLGTCDRTTQPGCSGVPVLRDTDRDGISDLVELFGKDDPSYPQYLPMWGANPRHKDVFVEADYNIWASASPFTADLPHGVRDYYSAGPASDLQNPDGANGISIHIDIGRNPTDPADATLFGDWGGANFTNQTDYGVSANVDRVPVRRNLFHHALAQSPCCGGQGVVAGDNFYWKINSVGEQDPTTFAHELGHNLNLEHYGRPSWGAVNCKPHYRSIMNYLYEGTVGFSLGAITQTLDPSNVNEVQPLPGINVDFMSGLYSTRDSQSVDWNRDGEFYWLPGNLRGAVAWSPTNGCESRIANAQYGLGIGAGQGARATPRLAMFRPRNMLYAFWIEPSSVPGSMTTQVRYAYANVGTSTAVGSCLAGGDSWGNSCLNWTNGGTLPLSTQGADEIDVLASEDSTVRIAIRRGGSILYLTGDVSGGDTIMNWSGPLAVQNLTSATGGPALSNITDGVTDKVAIFFTEPVNGVPTHRYVMTPYTFIGFSQRYTVQDSSTPHHVAQGSLTPGVTSFAPLGCGAGCSWRSPCGVFPNAQGVISFWCHNPSALVDGAWVDKSGDVGFGGYTAQELTTVDPPALAVHVTRSANGDLPRGVYNWGQLYMVTSNPTDPTWGAPHNPELFISTIVDSNSGPFWSTPWFVPSGHGFVSGSWDNDRAGSGFGMFENTRLGSLKAAHLRADVGVTFLPFLDGTVHVQLKDGNDFQVMERGMCLALSPAAGCGPVNQWGY